MRGLLVAAAVGMAACQCLDPVIEEDDGGTAGGGAPTAGGAAAGGRAGGAAGGGSTAGGGPGPMDAGTCLASVTCSGSGTQPQGCGVPPAQGFSCVERRCVWECPVVGPGRTCTVNMGSYCLQCGDGGTACPLIGTGCRPMQAVVQIEPGATCAAWPQSGAPFVDALFTRGASAQCSWLVSRPDGGEALGTLWKLDRDSEYVALFPGFGGWCTGRSAFTGAPRGIVTCPACSFVTFGFE